MRALRIKLRRTPEGTAKQSDGDRRTARDRTFTWLFLTVLIIGMGLGAGWIAGKSFSRALSGSEPAPSGAPSQDSSQGESATLPSHPEIQGRERNSGPESVDRPAQPKPDDHPTVAQPEPPKVPRVDKDEGTADKTVDEIPNEDQSTKEIGRKALKKMRKEIEKMNGNRPRNQRNANEDQQK